MKFFKKFSVSTSVSELPPIPKGYDDTFKASVEYFASSDIVANKHICNKERVILNRWASGELLCSSEELDEKLNKEVISKKATEKYSIEDKELMVADAQWFPRLRTIKYPLTDADAISRTSSEAELYDGFSGPWSWETTSLQEMGFPPTPETEVKNKANNAKKTKKKNKLSVTGEEEEDDLSDIRTLETLDELKARLKANYIEAKKQREKYLNLEREQTSEEKRIKSVKGTRDQSKQQQIVNRNKKNTTEATVDNVENVNGDKSSPEVNVKFTLGNKESSIADSFQSELESVLFKTSGNLPPDVPKKLELNLPKDNISPTSSPSKPLLESTNSPTPSSLDNTINTNKDINGSFGYFGSTGSDPMEINKLNVVVHNNMNKTSDISPAISSDGNLSLSPLDSRNRKSKNKLESTPKMITEFDSGFDSRDNSSVFEDSDKKVEKESVLHLETFATVDSSPAEENANESVIKNDNIELDMGLSGSGLGNVMDMLSNW